MSEPGEPPELWECENCGRRAVGGEGDGWVVAGEDRGHACATIPARLGPRVAFRVGLDDAGRALLACVLAMGRWGEAVGGVHPEARGACAAARKLLRLPETGPPTGGEREGEERPCP